MISSAMARDSGGDIVGGGVGWFGVGGVNCLAEMGTVRICLYILPPLSAREVEYIYPSRTEDKVSLPSAPPSQLLSHWYHRS